MNVIIFILVSRRHLFIVVITIRIITMKTINIALTDKAHAVLKTLTEKEKKNQSDIVSELLEGMKS